ncbi:MAG TPA: hypothetical protein VNZ65_11955, partial [Collimonas sp.]|nr:hypothetical protein [Collimonas sp.]
MQSNILFVTRSMGHAAVIAAGLFMSAVPLSAFAGETVNGFVDQAQVQAEAQAHETWRENVRQFAPIEEGCHHASYPNMKWEKVECGAKSSYRSAPRKIKHGDEKIFGGATPSSAQVDGNGTDYSIQAPSGSLISTAVGSFPSVTGVTSEKGVRSGSGNSDSWLSGGFASQSRPEGRLLEQGHDQENETEPHRELQSQSG